MTYSPKYTINEKIRTNLQDIEQLKSIVYDRRILPAAEAAIRLRATVDIVHSSTSIEGNPLNANEVRSIITTDKKLSKKEYAEIEVKNYKHALDFIVARASGNPEITESDILELHHIITDRLLDKTRSGHFRKNQVYIENQNHEILYEAAPVTEVEEDINNLLEWVNTNRAIIPAPIVAGILHYQFVAIHPFADGNGRTARALTMLYLAINHYDCNGTLSLDSYYASDKQAYYHILQATHGHDYSKSKNADLTNWLTYFTNGFLSSLHVLDAEIRILDIFIQKESDTLTREDQDILSYAAKFGSIEISEAEAILPEMNRRSIQRKLKKLVDAGYLELVGATHEVRYIIKNN